MSRRMYPPLTAAVAARRQDLAPRQEGAFRAFADTVFDDAALSRKTKQLIAVAVAHATQCPYCIRIHAKAARKAGATREQVMEAIWVAAEMRAGAAVAHAALALEAMDPEDPKPDRRPDGDP